VTDQGRYPVDVQVRDSMSDPNIGQSLRDASIGLFDTIKMTMSEKKHYSLQAVIAVACWPLAVECGSSLIQLTKYCDSKAPTPLTANCNNVDRFHKLQCALLFAPSRL
jgi:hypothetical protein